MKKLLLFTLIIYTNCSLFAQTFDFEGINYTVTSVTAPLTVAVAPNPGYTGEANIPSSVTYNSNEYSVTSIGTNAFYNCTALTSVVIPNSVTRIENYVFYNCTALTTVTIPNLVTSIGNYAFSYCADLTSVTMPNSITNLGILAFDGCINLNSVTIPNLLTTISSYAFRDCWSLTSITIPNSVTSIGEGAFMACSGLTSMTIPNSVTSIGRFAFRDCLNLTSITIPNSVTSIGSGAFMTCSGLTSVTIPNSVTSIGGFVFQDCRALRSVSVNWETPLAISFDLFQNVTLSGVTLYVPIGTEAAYEATAVWTNFGSIVLSANEFSILNKLKLYPNPVTSQVTLDLQDTANATLEVFSNNGRVLFTQKLDSNTSNNINVENLASGVYMFKVASTQGTAIKKVVKQ